MLIDLVIFPLLSIVIFATKYGLLYTGLASPVIFLTSLFALLHLALTVYTSIRMRGYTESVIPHSGLVNAVSFITSFVAVLSYILISYVPILKWPFGILSYIPTSQYWLDHLIVGIPTFLVFRLSEYVFRGILEDHQA